MGDLGSNILLDIGTLYLLKFYTDVLGLPGTYGGIIFLIAKFFTAFIPPVRTLCGVPGDLTGDCQLRRHAV